MAAGLLAMGVDVVAVEASAAHSSSVRRWLWAWRVFVM